MVLLTSVTQLQCCVLLIVIQVDRLCLNCNQMEQIVCECPCECPLDMNFCTGELLQEDDR